VIQVILPTFCKKCRDAMAIAADDGGMRCRTCRRDRGTLPSEAHAFVKQTIATFGELITPVVVRTNPSPCLRRQTGTAINNSAPTESEER
jgi:hypothetical protein